MKRFKLRKKVQFGEQKQQGEITEVESKRIRIEWEEGMEFWCSFEEVERWQIELTPKKKKDKVKKRLKELEDEKEKVREFTFSMSAMFDELDKRVKDVEKHIRKEQGERIVKAFTPVLTKTETAEKAAEQAPKETLEKRIEALVYDCVEIHEYSDYYSINYTTEKGMMVKLPFYLSNTDDEIVEKLKTIIKALNK